MTADITNPPIGALTDGEVAALKAWAAEACRAAVLADREARREPCAWAVPDEEGEVGMLFPTRDEAAAYCDDDAQPIPLFRGAA